MGRVSDAISLKCPQCGQSHLFESKNPYNLKKMFSMKKECENCGLVYEKEAGFFYGAMYISYAINIAFFVIATIAYFSYFDERVDWRYFMGIYLLIILLLSPIMFRLSRSIWLNIYTKFAPKNGN